MVLILCVLGFRMAVLTIVEGEEYRAVADIKKIKDIPVKAPRGKIFDRNGILLADNVSSFTVQMYTDEIDPDNFNNISHTLSKILDENGEKPIDEFPIELDTFDYIDEKKEKAFNFSVQENQITNNQIVPETIVYISAEEKVIQAVKDNIIEWLNFNSFIYNAAFSPKERVMDIVKRDKNVPVSERSHSRMKHLSYLKEENYEIYIRTQQHQCH